MCYGFATVFGRPLPNDFMRWFESNRVGALGVEWHPFECLHVTIVNCTRPCARSIDTLEGALDPSGVGLIKESALGVLFSCLCCFDQVCIEFEDMRVSGQSVILPSKESREISDLKRLLQGGRGCISEQEVKAVLASPDVFGVDKFSTAKGLLQPTLKMTLGNTIGDVVHLPTTSAPPVLNATSLHLVFYRDRKLINAVVSDDLEFDRSGSKKKVNKRRILDFFNRLSPS